MRGAGSVTLFGLGDAVGSTSSVGAGIVRILGVAGGVPTGHTSMGRTAAIALHALADAFLPTGSVVLPIVLGVLLAPIATGEKALLTDASTGL